ncbi:MAG: glycosyltransferase family 2 protein, partial [Rhodospirillaceae bacterium]|nr:glycosyltransferase family 2 protein [Rhodospirillaceae bacterium]
MSPPEMPSPASNAGRARVAVVVVSYNSGATLPRVLSALAAQTLPDFRLIVVDNASVERPRALLDQVPFAVTYLEQDQNLGFAGGMNVGLAAVTEPYLVALNPDAFPEPDWLAQLVAAADCLPRVAAFGSLQRDAADEARIDGFGDHYLFSGQAWRGAELPASSGPGPAYCFGACAAAALYRTEALRAIGGFDDRYFCFYEDVDVCFRLRLAGHQCAVIRDAVVRHVGGASFEGKSDFAEFLMARNAWWTLVKNMPGPLLALAAVSHLAVNALSWLKGGPRARFRGLREGLARTGEFLATRREVQSRRVVGAWDVA